VDINSFIISRHRLSLGWKTLRKKEIGKMFPSSASTKALELQRQISTFFIPSYCFHW